MTRRLGKRGKVWYNGQKAAGNVCGIGSACGESICRQNAENFENISGKAVKKLKPDTASERKDVPP